MKISTEDAERLQLTMDRSRVLYLSAKWKYEPKQIIDILDTFEDLLPSIAREFFSRCMSEVLLDSEQDQQAYGMEALVFELENEIYKPEEVVQTEDIKIDSKKKRTKKGGKK